MFEIIGYYFLRLLGWGWIWGKVPSGGADAVFGNGSLLMLIGMAVSFAVVLLMVLA